MIKDNQKYIIIFGVLLVIVLIINLCKNKKEPFINQNNEGIESFSNYETFYANKNDLCADNKVYETKTTAFDEKKFFDSQGEKLKKSNPACNSANKMVLINENILKQSIDNFKKNYTDKKKDIIDKINNNIIKITKDKEIKDYYTFILFLLEKLIFIKSLEELKSIHYSKLENDSYDEKKNKSYNIDFHYINMIYSKIDIDLKKKIIVINNNLKVEGEKKPIKDILIKVKNKKTLSTVEKKTYDASTYKKLLLQKNKEELMFKTMKEINTLFTELRKVLKSKHNLYSSKEQRCARCTPIRGTLNNKNAIDKCECYTLTNNILSNLIKGEEQLKKEEDARKKQKAKQEEQEKQTKQAAAAKAAADKAAAAKAVADKAAADKAAAAKAVADKEAAAKSTEDKKKAAHKNAEEQQKRSLSQGEILLEREISSVKANINNLELQLNDVRRKEQIKNQFDLKKLKDKERILEQELNNNINKLDQLSSAEKNKLLLSQSGKGYASYPIGISFRPIAIFGEKGVTERMMTNYDFDDQDILNQKNEEQNSKDEFDGYVGNICKNYLEL